MKTTIKLFIHQFPGQEQYALIADMSRWPEAYGALLGAREVEVDFEPFDIDPTEALIKSLEEQIASERAESQSRINLLLERISKLRCLEHKRESEV